MSRCGNKAHIEYEVSSELVGELATVTVERQGRETLTASAQVELKSEKNKIPWPDQPDGNGSFYGGRKVDWKGLAKSSYETKFKHQNFLVKIQVAGKKGKKSGEKVVIKPYANAGPEHRQIGLPMDIHQGPPIPQFNGAGALIGNFPNLFADSPAERANWVQTGSGTFRIEYKEGQVLIMIRLCLVDQSTNQPVNDQVFNHIKNRAESFWNDPGVGFRQWLFHREGCVRGDHCDCRVVYKGEGGRKEKMIQGGCCKFTPKVMIEKGNDNTVNVTFLTQQEIQSYSMQQQQWPGAFNTQQVCYPEDVPNSYAHEVGHMMGLPDEYAGGTVAAAVPSPFPITNDSIMGSSMQRAYERHLSHPVLFVEWINAEVTPVKVIVR